MLKPILELITIGARIFDKERTLYYLRQAENLEKKIHQVEDSDFYKKDMEAKGKAERELLSQVHQLRLQFVSEASAK